MTESIKIDKIQVRASLDRLYDVFKEIGGVANQVSKWRCPYKNQHDRCTANFDCRNQLHIHKPGDQAICTGSDKLDYRNAWEV